MEVFSLLVIYLFDGVSMLYRLVMWSTEFFLKTGVRCIIMNYKQFLLYFLTFHVTVTQTLSAADMRDPEISALIAAKLSEFHNLDMPGLKKAFIWDRLR